MLRCPRCGQQAARRSRRVGVRDRLLSVLHLYPFRCQLCGVRFRALQGQHHSTRHGERREYDRLVVRVPVTLFGAAGEAAGETVDLALDGCSVRTEATLDPGATLGLRLRLGAGGEVAVDAAVVRLQHEGSVSLQFTRMAPAERARLGRYLARFLRPSGAAPRRMSPRPQVLLAAVVGLAVILLVFLLMDRIGGPAVP